MSILLEQNYTYYNVFKYRNPRPKIRKAMIGRLRGARNPLVHRLAEKNMGFLELNHEFTPFAPLIKEAYPDAKFVHLVRDPKAVVSSFMRKFDPPPMSKPAYFGTRWSIKGQYVLRYGHVKRLAQYAPMFVREWILSNQYDKHIHPFHRKNGTWVEDMEMSTFEKTAWYWKEINGFVSDWFGELSDERKMVVFSEDLFDGNGNEISRLIKFVDPVDLTSSDLIEFMNAKKVNPKQVHSDFPPPANWNTKMCETLRSYSKEVAERLGYEI